MCLTNVYVVTRKQFCVKMSSSEATKICQIFRNCQIDLSMENLDYIEAAACGLHICVGANVHKLPTA